MRKRVLVATALLVALLSSVLVIRAMWFVPERVAAPPVTAVDVDPQAAARLAEAVRFRTVAQTDGTPLDRDAFLGLRDYLERSFPSVHARLKREVVGEFSLLYEWTGADSSLAPILLMAHMDVVPVEQGSEAQWTEPPFAGVRDGGYVWGRGTLDDKASMLGILEAVESLLDKGFVPRQTIYLAFGHDEEVGGSMGASRVAALLRSRNVHFAAVLDEGDGVADGFLSGVSTPIAFVGVAEKGYVSVELTATSPGGHSSAPPPNTAVGIVSAAVARLEENQMPARLTAPVERMLDRVGRELPFAERLVLANLWLFKPIVEREFAGDPDMNALVRTTTAATIFEAGVRENVLPRSARAVVNFRIIPGESSADVLEHVRRVVDDPRVQIEVGVTRAEPVAESSATTPAFRSLEKAIRQVYGNVVVSESILTGATDSRHFAPIAGAIYRFLPQRVGPGDVARLHGTDERIAESDYADSVRFYEEFIRNLSASDV